MTDEESNIDQLPDDLTPTCGCPARGAAFVEIHVIAKISAELVCFSGHLVSVMLPGGELLSLSAFGFVADWPWHES